MHRIIHAATANFFKSEVKKSLAPCGILRIYPMYSMRILFPNMHSQCFINPK